MTRTRSEYRLAPITAVPAPAALHVVHPDGGQRIALATLLLAAYRGTIDDEGETLADAVELIDHYFTSLIRQHSFVVVEDDEPVAFSFVVVVDSLRYIDPVVVAPDRKRTGLGRAIVSRSLGSLADAGVDTVGATITDGNVPSVRLFTSLGFVRHGRWG